uniref:Protein-L-isoaspartate O-methyltransferase domain-containing protein 1 n=1 Tax=Bursaphelenchus xylophilus TaxID=6326 RepID=A0A1I7SSK0_BURXY
MGIISSTGRNNDELVDNLVQGKYVRFKSVELAMRLVDRGDYFPEEERENAYKDMAWKETDSFAGPVHLSAPCIYANALEYLDLQPGLSFLNVGSGSGYLSTVAGFLLTETGVNHGVELYENMVEYAQSHLQDAMQTPAVSAFSFCQPVFFQGSAFYLKNNIMYDRIYCGALVPHHRRSFFANMLKINGILICPYGNELIRVKRTGARTFEVFSISQVSFSNLIAPVENRDFTKVKVVLPYHEAKSLQEICRIAIRKAVRNHVHHQCPLKLHFECEPTSNRSEPRRESPLGAVLVIGEDEERETEEGGQRNEGGRDDDDIDLDAIHNRVRREMDETMEIFRTIQRRHENIQRRIRENADPPFQRIFALVQNEARENANAERNRRATVGFVIADLEENLEQEEENNDNDRRRNQVVPLGEAFHDLDYPCEFEILVEAPEVDHIDMTAILPDYARELLKAPLTPKRRNIRRTNADNLAHHLPRNDRGIRLHTITYRAGRGRDGHRIEHVERLINRLRETTVRRQREIRARREALERSRSLIPARARPGTVTEAPREDHHDIHDEDQPTSTSRLGLQPPASTSPDSDRKSGTKRSAPESFNDYDSSVKRSASDGNIQEMEVSEPVRTSHSSPSASNVPDEELPHQGEDTHESLSSTSSSSTSSGSSPASNFRNSMSDSNAEDKADAKDEEEEKLQKERQKRANDQNQSLEVFHKHYIKLISGLPISERLIRFLIYDE